MYIPINVRCSFWNVMALQTTEWAQQGFTTGVEGGGDLSQENRRRNVGGSA